VTGFRATILWMRSRVVRLGGQGTVPNFNDIQREILGLENCRAGRLTPSLMGKPGAAPRGRGFDLAVKDTLPLHGSVELEQSLQRG